MFHYDWGRSLTRLADWIFQQFPSPFLLLIPLGLVPVMRAFFCSGDLWSPSAAIRHRPSTAPGQVGRRYSPFVAFLLGAMFTNLAFFLGYETWDQFAFYLETFVCLAVLGTLGAAWCWQKSGRAGRCAIGVLLGVSALLPPLIYPQIPRWAVDDTGYWSRRYHAPSVAYAGRYDLVGIYADPLRLQQQYNQRPDVRLMLLQPPSFAGWGTPADELIAACNAGINRVFITANHGPAAAIVTALQFGGWRAEKFPLGDEYWIFELLPPKRTP
ncbi:MAG: hypothetical protein NTY53_20910 [Kiritimatiellaeota bacterium]|nr:hypothetical protein [Kiritimatiellota bacterium]